MQQPPYSLFLGVWELDPDTLDYQYGRPGRRARYTIEPLPGGLRFILDADDADGKPLHIVYGGKLDGQGVPLPDTSMTLAFEKVDANTIESTLNKNGQVIDRWTRSVQGDGQSMLITQHGFKPDGQPFRNNGVYRRVSGHSRLAFHSPRPT